MDGSIAGGGADLIDIKARIEEGDVFVDGPGEQRVVLHDGAEAFAPDLTVDIFNSDAVESDAALSRFLYAQDEFDERGLACAGWADDSDASSGGDFEETLSSTTGSVGP